MEVPDAASIPWFVDFMLLHNRGLIPTVSPPDQLPDRPALAEFFGPKSGSGFTFDNQGDTKYENYVKELHRRVLQLHWPLSGVLAFHFARGVLAEANGLEVNWAEFAYKQTHPHQSYSTLPRVLPEFEDLKFPLPPLVKVTPRTGPLRIPPTISTEQEMPGAEERPPGRVMNASAGKAKIGESSRKRSVNNPDMAELNADTLCGLFMVRVPLSKGVEAERHKLRQSLHDAESEMIILKSRVKEETERLKVTTRRLAEKRDTHAHALAENDRCMALFNAARNEEAKSPWPEQRTLHAEFVRRCETLLNSWALNLATAHFELGGWDFKERRQTAHVNKIKQELTAAENAYVLACATIETSLNQLESVSEFIGRL